jgi:hypothetical protein
MTAAWATPPAPAVRPAVGAKKKPVFSLDLPQMGAIPKDLQLVGPRAEEKAEDTRAAKDTSYQVTSVQHAKQFMRSPKGASPIGGALSAIALKSKPPVSEKFTTLLRLTASNGGDAPIDVQIVDAEGNAAMSATGEVRFRAAQGNTTEYAIDWDPTPFRSAGEYKVLIRVAGKELGRWPLQVTSSGQ